MHKGDNKDNYKNNENWNHVEINQKILEQDTWKVRQGNSDTIHPRQCSHSGDSIDVTVATICLQYNTPQKHSLLSKL